MLNPRRVLSKAQILQNVWRYDFGGNSNVVETYVSYLRKKLDAAGPPLIRTVRQVGYMLDARAVVLAPAVAARAARCSGVLVARGGRARRRRRRDLHVAALVPLRPHRQLARRPTHVARSQAARPRPAAARHARATLGGAVPGSSVEVRARIQAASVVPPAQSARRPRRRRRGCRDALAVPPADAADRDASATSRSPATSGGDRYRVRASIEPDAPASVLIVARLAARRRRTLHRLLLIELLVTARRARRARRARPLGRPARPAAARRDRADRRRDRRRRPLAARRARRRRAPRSAGSGSR